MSFKWPTPISTSPLVTSSLLIIPVLLPKKKKKKRKRKKQQQLHYKTLIHYLSSYIENHKIIWLFLCVGEISSKPFLTWKVSHTHTHTHTHIYIYIYIYIERERERDRQTEIGTEKESLGSQKKIQRKFSKFRWGEFKKYRDRTCIYKERNKHFNKTYSNLIHLFQPVFHWSETSHLILYDATPLYFKKKIPHSQILRLRYITSLRNKKKIAWSFLSGEYDGR